MTHTDTEPGVNLVPASPKALTNAQRQCRYRERHSKEEKSNEPRNETSPIMPSDGVTVLCAEQSKITIEFDEHGNALLRQSEWPDDDDVILIRRDNIPDFIDRLTDALGIPTFGRP